MKYLEDVLPRSRDQKEGQRSRRKTGKERKKERVTLFPFWSLLWSPGGVDGENMGPGPRVYPNQENSGLPSILCNLDLSCRLPLQGMTEGLSSWIWYLL